jgi:hypothetical protein
MGLIAQTNELIDAFGGTKPFAELTGVTVGAVYQWRRAGCLPPRLMRKVKALAKERGIDAPDEIFEERHDPRNRGSWVA